MCHWTIPKARPKREQRLQLQKWRTMREIKKLDPKIETQTLWLNRLFLAIIHFETIKQWFIIDFADSRHGSLRNIIDEFSNPILM